MTDPKTHEQATVCHGLTDDTSGLARFGRHPDPAIDFCVQVETLESRLHQAQHGLCKPGDEPETVENVLAAIERAMDFRVGGDEGAINAKAILRELETKARASLVPAPAVLDDVAEIADTLRKATFTKGRTRGGVGGQTIEANMRSTFHEVSAWDLNEAADTIEAQSATIAAIRAERDRLQAELARIADGLVDWSHKPADEMRDIARDALTQPTGGSNDRTSLTSERDALRAQVEAMPGWFKGGVDGGWSHPKGEMVSREAVLTLLSTSTPRKETAV